MADGRLHLVLNILLFAWSLGSLFAQETGGSKCLAVWYVKVDTDLTVRWMGEDRSAIVNVTLFTNETYGRDCNANETFIVPFRTREVKLQNPCSNAFYRIVSIVTCDLFTNNLTNTITTPPDALEIYNVTTTNTTFAVTWLSPAGPIHGYNVCLTQDERRISFVNYHCFTAPCSFPVTTEFKDLHPYTVYSISGSSFSLKGGWSTWSKVSSARTKGDYPPARIAGIVVGCLLLVIAISAAVLFLLAKKKGGLRNIIKKKSPATSFRTLKTSVSSPMNTLSDSETVNVRNFDQHVLKLMANGYCKLAQEFEKLGKESPAFPSNEARKSDNLKKNRWVKILPFDHTRVKLMPVGDEVDHDFINASYVAGESHLLEYIATQGPLPNTVNDFWRMAWQESVFNIVMLTQCEEGTCERYWPAAGETRTYGPIEVKTVSESITQAHIVRIFLVSQEGKQRQIVHIHYRNWPVFGCPKSPDDFVSFIKTAREQISCVVTGPMIVHCSAGIGRTGTFIAVDRLCQQIEHGSETANVYGTVLEMRRYRANMVQTEEQYNFIYLCMQRVIQEKRQELEYDCGR